jgi:Fic family protein
MSQLTLDTEMLEILLSGLNERLDAAVKERDAASARAEHFLQRVREVEEKLRNPAAAYAQNGMIVESPPSPTRSPAGRLKRGEAERLSIKHLTECHERGATVDEVVQATSIPISSAKRVLAELQEQLRIFKSGPRYYATDAYLKTL